MERYDDVGETPMCGEHQRSAAEALCLKHLQFVCMKCIVEDKKHSSKKCETKTLRNMSSESDRKLVNLLLMKNSIVKRREQLEKHVTYAEKKREELRAQIDSYYMDITRTLQTKYVQALKYVDNKSNVVKKNNANRMQAIDAANALFEGEIERLTNKKSKTKEISMVDLSRSERSLPATCLTIVSGFQPDKHLKHAVSVPLGHISYIEDDTEAYDTLDEGVVNSGPPPEKQYETPIQNLNKPAERSSGAYEPLTGAPGVSISMPAIPIPLPVPETVPQAGSSYEQRVIKSEKGLESDNHYNTDKAQKIDTSCPANRPESSPTSPETPATPTGRRVQPTFRSNSIVEKYFPGIESGTSSVKLTTPTSDKAPTFIAQTSDAPQRKVCSPNISDTQALSVAKPETPKNASQTSGYLSMSKVKLDIGAAPLGSKVTPKSETLSRKSKGSSTVETRSMKLFGETGRRRRLSSAVLLPANRVAFLDELNSCVVLARTDGRLICETEGEQLLAMAGCGKDDIAVLGRSKGLHISIYMAFGERSLERRVCVQVAAPEVPVVNGFQFDETSREFAIGGAGKVVIVQESGRMKTSMTFKNELPERCDVPEVRTCYDFQEICVYVLYTKSLSLVKYNFDKQEVAWQTTMESGKQLPRNLCLGESLVYIAFPDFLKTYSKATGSSDWPVDTTTVLKNITGVTVDERIGLALVTSGEENEDASNTFAIVGL